MSPLQRFSDCDCLYQFVEERRGQLEVYIKALVGDATILNQSQTLWEFLNVSAPCTSKHYTAS